MIHSLKSNWFPCLLFAIIFIPITCKYFNNSLAPQHSAFSIQHSEFDSTWQAPSLYIDQQTTGKERAMIIYGEQLIANTSEYLGPNGTVAHISNGMNCQNCHLYAGTLPWGNNYGAVYSTYPKYRARSNSIDNIYKRINDCFERSLNGKGLDTTSYEMQSMYAYIKWLGKDVAKGKKPYSSGLPALPFMDRPADVGKGKLVYINTCQRCHGNNGEGLMNTGVSSYQYPPLWGNNSYNDGAGLYRITRFASFVKNNMPYNEVSRAHPLLTNEQAWDVAAFVNSQPRPHKDQSEDWKDITKKSIDEPFGPYADGFSEQQHKFGPYGPINEFYKSKN